MGNRATRLIAALALLLSVDAIANWQVLSADSEHLLERHSQQPDGVQALRLTTTINAPLTRLVAILQAVEQYPQFLPHFQQVQRLGHEYDAELVYFKIAPPLIAPRDYVLKIHSQLSPSASSYQRHWYSANQHAPEADAEVIRLWLVEGRWSLYAIDGQRTRVVHEIRTEMGGKLPDWLVQMASEHGLRQVVEAVARRASSN